MFAEPPPTVPQGIFSVCTSKSQKEKLLESGGSDPPKTSPKTTPPKNQVTNLLCVRNIMNGEYETFAVRKLVRIDRLVSRRRHRVDTSIRFFSRVNHQTDHCFSQIATSQRGLTQCHRVVKGLKISSDPTRHLEER
jgi:hypothetical protein